MSERLPSYLSQQDYEPPIQEHCGVVAIWTVKDCAAQSARSALSALQHRGQESAGMTTYNKDGTLTTHTGMGLVLQVLSDKVGSIPSHAVIAHNRYSTTGASIEGNAQPFTLSDGQYTLSIGHNGNLINVDLDSLRKLLQTKSRGSSDTAYLTAYLLQERRQHSTWEETFLTKLPSVEGAYSMVMLTENGHLFATRDPYEVRPMSIGILKDDDGWIIASETVALDIIGAHFLRHVKGGELIHIDEKGNLKSSFFGKPVSPKHCLFENIYFSRPDSLLDGQRIRAGREQSGKLLAQRLKEKDIKPDVVVPIFNSGYSAARGLAEESGIRAEDVITVSHYTGRTFIRPGQEARIESVNGKFNITPDEIVNKNVLTVDDSGVRLTTGTILNCGIKEAGAKSVNDAYASPPVVNHCDLGVDMHSKDLPASKWKNEPLEVIEKNVAKHISAESVTYLPIKQTTEAFGSTPDTFCHFCFGGAHPIYDAAESFRIRERLIGDKARLAVLISGNGTNLQNMIDVIDAENMEAIIVGVVSNKLDAYGLTRAQNHSIPTTVVPSRGRLKEIEERKKFEEELFSEIKKMSPDIIVLSGWMVVLSDDFITKSQQLEIPIINLHPALLTREDSEEVMTSRGKIPVIRGTHAIEDAYNQNIRVSGVTVHQVTPSPSDTGPIILQEEIRRIKGESLEEWEQRIHAAEYRILPTALKRVIHVMKQGVDVADGKFPW